MEKEIISKQLNSVIANVSSVVIGKEHVLEQLLIALLASGHVILEDVPGTGKTLLAKSLGRTLDGNVRRIQFTADLLPSDVTGINFYNQAAGRFELRQGPIFTNILLADELNRATPRTQSSLLECMEERQVTIDGVTHPLEAPFMVIATQNPIDNHGTFPLPEAQLDRFMMCISMGYPTPAEELAILQRFSTSSPIDSLKPIINKQEIQELQSLVPRVYASEEIINYLIAIVTQTRNHSSIAYGISPRGSLQLLKAAQARALLRGRDFVVPDDIKQLIKPVLAHRILLKDTYRGELNRTDLLLDQITSAIAVPTEAALESL